MRWWRLRVGQVGRRRRVRLHGSAPPLGRGLELLEGGEGPYCYGSDRFFKKVGQSLQPPCAMAAGPEGVVLLKRGIYALKHRHGSKPRWTLFTLSKDASVLSWRARATNCGFGGEMGAVRVGDIFEVSVGRRNGSFLHRSHGEPGWEHLSVTVRLLPNAASASREPRARKPPETLDVSFDREHEFGYWLAAIRWLVKSQRSRRSEPTKPPPPPPRLGASWLPPPAPAPPRRLPAPPRRSPAPPRRSPRRSPAPPQLLAVRPQGVAVEEEEPQQERRRMRQQLEQLKAKLEQVNSTRKKAGRETPPTSTMRGSRRDMPPPIIDLPNRPLLQSLKSELGATAQ